MIEETFSPINRGQMLKGLLGKFLEIDKGIEAIIISDVEGLVIAGEKRKDINLEIISFLTAVVNPIIERIRNEFAFKRFGTASFDTDEHRLIFISIDGSTTLSLVFEDMVSIDKLYPYAYFLSEKIAQILNARDGDTIQLKIPNFEHEKKLSKRSGRLKYQIYQEGLALEDSFRFKFIIIGDHKVGKTSLIRRFVDNAFLDEYRTTIGLNILSHNFEVFGNKVDLSLWDIGAQRYFKRYRKTYYRGAQAAFIVFDVTSRESYDNITNWYLELNEFIEEKDLPIVIVGNKIDLAEQRVISHEEGINLPNELSNFTNLTKGDDLTKIISFSNLTQQPNPKISYIETSALTGDHVEEAFNLLAYKFIEKSKDSEELWMKEKIYKEINSILKNIGRLTLSFLTEDPLWSPCLQILTELNELGEILEIKEGKEEKIYNYSNGLILKNYTYKSLKKTESDGVFCIFDAREREHINPIWKDTILEIEEKIKKNQVLIVGIRVSENIDWSSLLDEFKISEELEDKIGSVLFFKIGEKFRQELYELLEFMLNFIKQRLMTKKLDDSSLKISTVDLKEELQKREKAISSKVSDLKSKIEGSDIADEIRIRKAKRKEQTVEAQDADSKTTIEIEKLSNKIIKYEKKGKKKEKISELYYNLGRKYIDIQEYDKAVEVLDYAVEIQPDFAVAWNVLGAIYYEKGEYDQAINMFHQLARIKSNNSNVWYNIGRVYFKNGEYDNAIEVLERAVQIDPHSAPAWNCLAMAYFFKGDFSGALEKFNELASLTPDDPKVWYNLGRVYVKNAQYDKAIEVLKRGIEIDSSFGAAWNVLGAAYYGKEDYDLAINAFQQFVVLEPEDHAAWYNLGEALYIVAKYDEALVACNYSLEIMHDFAEALNLRERVLSNL